MVVLVLTACPDGLRGHLTRWLLEISPGVFVGHVTQRVRDLLWSRVLEMCHDGRAILVFGIAGEQRLDFKVHNHDWKVIDLDGLKLMLRPSDRLQVGNPMRHGWSKASKLRRVRR